MRRNTLPSHEVDMPYARKVAGDAWTGPCLYVVGWDNDGGEHEAGWFAAVGDLVAKVAEWDSHSEGYETFAERVDPWVDGDGETALDVIRDLALAADREWARARDARMAARPSC